MIITTSVTHNNPHIKTWVVSPEYIRIGNIAVQLDQNVMYLSINEATTLRDEIARAIDLAQQEVPL